MAKKYTLFKLMDLLFLVNYFEKSDWLNQIPMIKKILSSIFFLIVVHYSVNAQFSFKLQTGVSYIEHFSTGITFSFSERHNLSLLYGSNFFIKPQDFSCVMLQYDFLFNKINFAGIIPGIGIKGGYSVYTNSYYKWSLSSFVPFIGLRYQIDNKFGIALDIGTAISIEHSVERINYGEIGMYKEYLPEFKLGLTYKL